MQPFSLCFLFLSNPFIFVHCLRCSDSIEDLILKKYNLEGSIRERVVVSKGIGNGIIFYI